MNLHGTKMGEQKQYREKHALRKPSHEGDVPTEDGDRTVVAVVKPVILGEQALGEVARQRVLSRGIVVVVCWVLAFHVGVVHGG